MFHHITINDGFQLRIPQIDAKAGRRRAPLEHKSRNRLDRHAERVALRCVFGTHPRRAKTGRRRGNERYESTDCTFHGSPRGGVAAIVRVGAAFRNSRGIP